MRRTLAALSLCLLLLAHAKGVASTPRRSADAEQQVVETVRQLAEAQKNFDVSKLEELLAPDYVEISPAGEVDPRQKVLSFYTPEKRGARTGELLSYELDEISTRLYGEMAVVVARLPFSSKSPDGKVISRAFRCVFVCRRLKGKWRLVSAQYTGIRT